MVSYVYAFGIISVIYLAIRVLYNLYKFYTIHFLEPAVDVTKLGKWAVVTGSTDGIGKAIAYELANRGLDIFLISRNPEKLKKVADEIKTLYGVDTKVLAFDFTKFDPTTEVLDPYSTICSAIDDLDIGIMVNNVGMGTGRVGVFHKTNKPNESLSKSTSDLIHCNASSRAKMMEVILPGMMSRKRGLIINISSMSGALVTPVLSSYAATKRFDDTLSISMSNEYRNNGVIIQSIQPGFVRTNMTKILGTKENAFFPSAAAYVHHMMRTIGKTDSTNGYWAHSIMHSLFISLPEGMAARSMLKNFLKMEK